MLDGFLVLARNRRLVAIVTAIFLIVGFLVAFTRTPSYTSTARVIRETAESITSARFSGLSVLQGLGINLGGSTVGITVDTYPDILLSREVRLSVVRSRFHFNDLDSTMTLVDYLDRPLGLFGYIFGLLPRRSTESVIVGSTGAYSHTSSEEESAMNTLLEWATVNVSRSTSIMDIRITTHDPLLSTQITQTFVNHLTERVQDIYTEKTRENLEFIRARFLESQRDLELAEEELARFMDRNRNPTTARLRVAMERLQRKVMFKTQLAGDLQTQLTQAEIELQRSQPVITLIEGPNIPIAPSAPRRKLIVVFSLFAGLSIGIGLVIIKSFFERQASDSEARSKFLEIREAFVPRRLIKWRRRS